jgi:hypothetical protein
MPHGGGEHSTPSHTLPPVVRRVFFCAHGVDGYEVFEGPGGDEIELGFAGVFLEAAFFGGIEKALPV